MTRRQWFTALAAGLKMTRPLQSNLELFNEPNEAANLYHQRLTQWLADVKAVARVCAASNPHFNFNRFYETCGADELVAPDLGGS